MPTIVSRAKSCVKRCMRNRSAPRTAFDGTPTRMVTFCLREAGASPLRRVRREASIGVGDPSRLLLLTGGVAIEA